MMAQVCMAVVQRVLGITAGAALTVLQIQKQAWHSAMS